MDLNRRNTAAVEQQLKEQDKIIREQQVRIDGLVSSLSSLQERMNLLEQSLNMMRAMLAGRGPSV